MPCRHATNELERVPPSVTKRRAQGEALSRFETGDSGAELVVDAVDIPVDIDSHGVAKIAVGNVNEVCSLSECALYLLKDQFNCDSRIPS